MNGSLIVLSMGILTSVISISLCQVPSIHLLIQLSIMRRRRGFRGRRSFRRRRSYRMSRGGYMLT